MAKINKGKEGKRRWGEKCAETQRDDAKDKEEARQKAYRSLRHADSKFDQSCRR